MERSRRKMKRQNRISINDDDTDVKSPVSRTLMTIMITKSARQISPTKVDDMCLLC